MSAPLHCLAVFVIPKTSLLRTCLQAARPSLSPFQKYFSAPYNPHQDARALPKHIHTDIKAPSKRMYLENRSNNFIGKHPPPPQFSISPVVPPFHYTHTHQFWVMWKKLIKLRSQHIALGLILLAEISSAVRMGWVFWGEWGDPCPLCQHCWSSPLG